MLPQKAITVESCDRWRCFATIVLLANISCTTDRLYTNHHTGP